MTHIADRTNFQAPFDARWNILSEFVAETCKGRDDSHGYAHMKAVAETSEFIKTPAARAIADIRHKGLVEWLQAHTTSRVYMFGDD